MKDPVERQDVIDAICDNCHTVEAICPHYPCDRYVAVEKLPPAQTEPQWIPVSERLPEVGRSVLFSRRSMDTREGCLQADGKWWQYRWNEMLNADQVTAWMPLPEPYRAERRADEDD